MHKNLIKINELLAFANNSEGVISLISKKNKDYSFEDIQKKEQEIDELNKEVNDLNIGKDKIIRDNEFVKEYFPVEVFMGFLITGGIIFSGVDTLSAISDLTLLEMVFMGIIYTFFVVFGVYGIKHVLNSYKTIKKNNKDVKDKEEEIEKVRKLLNNKKEELERMLDKVDFRENSKKEEIESIISNMLNITPSNEQDNTLNNDLSNTINLDGPSRERIK